MEAAPDIHVCRESAMMIHLNVTELRMLRMSVESSYGCGAPSQSLCFG